MVSLWEVAERDGDIGKYTQKKTTVGRDGPAKGTERERQRASGRVRRTEAKRESKDMERETE